MFEDAVERYLKALIIEDKGIEEDEPSNAIGNRFSNFRNDCSGKL